MELRALGQVSKTNNIRKDGVSLLMPFVNVCPHAGLEDIPPLLMTHKHEVSAHSRRERGSSKTYFLADSCSQENLTNDHREEEV